ncbi:MAG: DUF29 domain-containing protein [Aphanothece sp. CMT-3BRIN-NPC111]|jgi:hypothetical protein|nr:DUF29 domain-containing protein [Aphanothece sp. CMT-3BRIN-NPC111]
MTTNLNGTSVNNTDSLYEKDFQLWLDATAKMLRERQLEQLDFNNLIEEVESMGRSEKDALESNLVVVLMHLFKYKYQPERRSNSWLSSIYEHRRRIRRAFYKSPSLKNYLNEVFAECYKDARQEASLETGLPLEVFPIECPFNVEETLNPDYLPE